MQLCLAWSLVDFRKEKMIKLSFLFNREVLNFIVDNKVIKYQDRKWEHEIQCIPRDDAFIQKITWSRNRLPAFLIDLFTLTKAEQEEYDNAKTDEELAEIIIRDASLKGCRLMFREQKK